MPAPRLKPVAEQVIVITGATSGIGLATARMAAERGASLVIVARNEEALNALAQEIRDKGGRAEPVVADVSDMAQVEKISEAAIRAYGGFDSWCNNAAVALYGEMEDVPLEDQRRLFDVNYWGVVHGMLVASRHLKGKGGAIVNTGSVLSDRAMALQGAYSAAKFAVKAATDSFRMEFEAEGYPISVTLIRPGSIDTPYPEHARNKMSKPARLPQPIYDVELVAKAICFAAEHRRRALIVGGGGLALTTLAPALPRLADKGMELLGDEAVQTTGVPPAPGTNDNLFEPRADGRTESNQEPFTRQTSLFLEVQMHPLAATAIVGGVAAAIGGAAWALGHRGQRDIGSREAERRIRAAGMTS
jgi:short-subunit dehydrogenase